MKSFIKTIMSAFKQWTEKKIEEKINIIPTIEPDWNQNDESALDYIKNRTHWEGIEDVALIPPTQFTISENETRTTIPVDWYFNLGQIYIVELDGVKYNCVCRPWDQMETYMLGNGTIYGDGDKSNGEPFSCMKFYPDLYFYTSPGKHTVAIYVPQNVIHKLDTKYLPDYIGTQVNWNEEDVNSKAYILNKPDVDSKMSKDNPIGAGSLSINRKENTAIGEFSTALGYESIASGHCSNASGLGSVASQDATSASGKYNIINPAYELQEQLTPSFQVGGYYYSADDYTFDPLSGIYKLVSPTTYTTKLTFSNLKGKYLIDSASKYRMYYREPAAGTTSTGGKYIFDGVRIFSSKKLESIHAHIVGNGTSDTERSNAHTLDWGGNAWYQGDVYVGSTSGIDRDEGSKKLATEEYVDAAISGIKIPEGGEISPEAIKGAVDEYLEANPPAQGEPGKTPIKGVDYFTQEEIQEITEQAAEMVEVEVPDTYTRQEIDAIMEAYINDIDALIGGDS